MEFCIYPVQLDEHQCIPVSGFKPVYTSQWMPYMVISLDMLLV